MDNCRNIIDMSRVSGTPQRWVLQLDCGHDVWVTRQRRPRVLCLVCPSGCTQAIPSKDLAQLRAKRNIL